MNIPTSAALIAQIDNLTVPRGQLALWSLGQSGFVIKGGATIAYIDPYLSDPPTASGGSARRFPVPLDPRAASHAQIVFATHEHSDHANAATLGPLMAASARATLVTSHGKSSSRPRSIEWSGRRAAARPSARQSARQRRSRCE